MERLEELVERVVRSEGLELYDLEFEPGCLRVYVDELRGVTVERCRELSQMLSRALDAADLIPGPYRLEVSSPGVERRLTRPEHFKRSLGAEIRVVAQQGFHEGRLVSVSEDGIWIDNTFLSFSAIKHARLKIATEELFRRER